MKKIIQVIFSDTKQKMRSTFENVAFEKDHLALSGVATYVDWTTPYIEELGCDHDGDVVYNSRGFIYFDAVDRVEVIRDDLTSVIFEKSERIVTKRRRFECMNNPFRRCIS